MTSSRVPLHYQPLAGVADPRPGEPMRCGIPCPRGRFTDPGALRLLDADGSPLALQCRILDRWQDGSVRWLLLDWLAGDGDRAALVLDGEEGAGPPAEPAAPAALAVDRVDGRLEVDTGALRCTLGAGGFPFASAEVDGRPAIDPRRCGLTATDDANCRYRLAPAAAEIEEAGPVRAVARIDGALEAAGGSRLLEVTARLHFFAGSPVVRVDLAVTNPRRAGHPGGIWELGGDGSVLLRDLSLAVARPEAETPAAVLCSAEPGRELAETAAPLELLQESSGGDNWRSRAHLDRDREVPLRFRGYRLRAGGDETTGRRATPIVVVRGGGVTTGLAVAAFWQNFPKAVEASGAGIILRLLPRRTGSCHEIQGGERKTHTFHLACGEDPVDGPPLEWCRSPRLAHAEPGWYADSEAVPFLTPWAEDPHRDYLDLVRRAIEGPDALERKREVVDEYGWRHFGDVWADHEAHFDDGEEPLISHYNNQYDMVHGLAVQFLRSADGRWHRLMDELARHVADVDRYHTRRDKSTYNGGMFWHTVHYTDAGLSTHRSYPRAEGVPGGGPSTGHLYASGLLLHHYLTGEESSRRAVVELGDYVIDADDGRRTVFRFLDRGPTGHVSNSGFGEYHGPGRSGANAVTALLDAHRVTGDDRYLDKAEQLVRRCIHPHDDLEALDLLDADRKWFYTMFLQSLGAWLDHEAERGRLDAAYAYGRAALLHYARWAAEHEYPYLDKPEILEFPTETWAAQDLRKCELFLIAARHAPEAERPRLLERARFFFDDAVARLKSAETGGYARPLALLLGNGWRRAWFELHELRPAPAPDVEVEDFGTPQVFVSQKRRALGRVRRIVVGLWAAAVLALGAAAVWLSLT